MDIDSQIAEMIPRTPPGVGVPSVCAYAALILGKPVPPLIYKYKPEVLGLLIGVPYADLHQPGSGSPLYPMHQAPSIVTDTFTWLPTAPTDLAALAAVLPYPLATLPLRRKEAFDLTWGQSSGPNATYPPAAAGVGWTGGGAPTAGVSWETQGIFSEDGRTARDLQQGRRADCWLVAALAALAWTRKLPQVSAVGTPPTAYQFPSVGGQTLPLIPRTVPFFNYDPLYLHSSTEDEAWCGLWEKAYAVLKSQLNPDGTTDYSVLDWGFPKDALAAIRPSLTHTSYDNQPMSNTLFPNVLAALGSSLTSSGRCRTPVTAYTWISPPTGVQYTTHNVVACHAYTVLGAGTFGGMRSLVLRNPTGKQYLSDAANHVPFDLVNADPYWGKLYRLDTGLVAVPEAIVNSHFENVTISI